MGNYDHGTLYTYTLRVEWYEESKNIGRVLRRRNLPPSRVHYGSKPWRHVKAVHEGRVYRDLAVRARHITVGTLFSCGVSY